MPDRIATLLAFLADDPSDAFTRFALAQEYAKAGRTDEARAAYESLVADDPAYVGTYYHLGKLCESTGDDAAARRAYTDGIAAATAARDLHARAELQSALLALDLGDDL